MTFMDSERKIERVAHLREQASKMWEEAENGLKIDEGGERRT